MKTGEWVYVNGRLGIHLKAIGEKAEVHFVDAKRETVAEQMVPLADIKSANIHDEKALKAALAKVGAK